MANLGPQKEDRGVVAVTVPHPQLVVGARLGLPWDLVEYLVSSCRCVGLVVTEEGPCMAGLPRSVVSACDIHRDFQTAREDSQPVQH
jgi:hypothetical protein